jgi:uncharacterized membrane protein
LVIVGGAAASGAGVALGRFGRLNSWEVVTRPVFVADETMRLSSDRQALAVAAFFTLLVLVMYIGTASGRTRTPRADRHDSPERTA